MPPFQSRTSRCLNMKSTSSSDLRGFWECRSDATRVHVLIGAKSMDDKLRYAALPVPNVTLLEYEIDFKLRPAGLLGVQIGCNPCARLDWRKVDGRQIALCRPSSPERHVA